MVAGFAAAQHDSRSLHMFVLPLAPSRGVATQRAFDRLFDESLDRFFGGASTPASRTPAMDVSESDDAYALVFEVPGASRKPRLRPRRPSNACCTASARPPVTRAPWSSPPRSIRRARRRASTTAFS